jgi:hypothetical protein
MIGPTWTALAKELMLWMNSLSWWQYLPVCIVIVLVIHTIGNAFGAVDRHAVRQIVREEIRKQGGL